ncbi:zf-HC2 domain-containing protein [Rhodoferax sp. PAMC 29310]|uniref:zf-HC2 domain-containing protein n=1 Tax=Rhodoferax sp. PAMC 29310 TaxID=2822760 RepID=UPI001F0AB50F|nr:zf-HC2 domain-containing protein [Rhodoferax sp. PAMC 29310]
MMPFLKNCKEITALVTAREDRALGWRDRLAVRMHMAMCAACPNFERQMLTMRNAMAQWRNYEGEDALSGDFKGPEAP